LASSPRVGLKDPSPQKATPAAASKARQRLPTPKGLDDRVSRNTILNAALKAFSVHGFAGASITSIARIYHVSPALIHYYFKNKDELWRAALDHGFGDVIGDLTETMRDLGEFDSVSRLKFFIRRYIAIVADRPEVFDVIIRESASPGPRLLWLTKRHLNPLYGLWTTLVEAAQNEGKIKSMVPPYHVSQIIVGASYQFMASRVRMHEAYGVDVTSKELRERHAEAVLDILFTGLLTNPAGTK
jgi:TetR/AcrR family transcriptional regulator